MVSAYTNLLGEWDEDDREHHLFLFITVTRNLCTVASTESQRKGVWAMKKVGDYVDITKLNGSCVFCEKVIFIAGECAVGVRAATLKHIKGCKKHPLRGFNHRKHADDARGPDEGEGEYRAGPRNG